MDRKEATKRTRELLCGDQRKNKDSYNFMFVNWNYSDPELTTISPIFMQDVNSKRKIEISESAYDDLFAIREWTRETFTEAPFFLTGEEREDGTIAISSVTSVGPNRLTKDAVENFKTFFDDYMGKLDDGSIEQNGKPVFCYGHTHAATKTGSCFTFSDLITYYQIHHLDDRFMIGKIKTLGLLLPQSGDFNFIEYDDSAYNEDFFKFPSVTLVKDDGKRIPLPAYKKGEYFSDKIPIFKDEDQPTTDVGIGGR